MPNPSKKPIDIEGVTQRDFDNWKHNPVTKMFLKYLYDYRGAMRAQVVERWEDGALQLIDEKEARGRTLALKEIVGLQFHHITDFYGIEQEEEDGSEEDSDR